MSDPHESAPVGGLNREKILLAARDVVRRHGPTKATVVDVAQALGVSHGSIYRFFPTKVALREAVVGAWLDQIAGALEGLTFDGPARNRLRAWFDAFFRVKQAQRSESPELFEAFRVLSAQEPEAIAAYKQRLETQIGALLAEGVSRGEFCSLDPAPTARAFLNATLRFHHPAFAHDWGSTAHAGDFETLWTILVRSICVERNPV